MIPSDYEIEIEEKKSEIFRFVYTAKSDKMKKHLVMLIILLPIALNAQQNSDILYSVYYDARFRIWEDSNRFHEDRKVLEICPNQSHFYGVMQNIREEFIDSMSTHGGDMLEAMYRYPTPRQSYHVYKNHPMVGQLTYHDKSPRGLIYNDYMERPVWRILPGDTTIIGYKCQKAITVFRDREWIVWFTTDIPVSEGPWKLWGLSGLILQAEDSKHDFSFICTEIIPETDKQMKPPKTGKFIRCTRRRFNAENRAYGRDPIGYLKKTGKQVGPGFDANGKPIVYKVRVPVFLDY